MPYKNRKDATAYQRKWQRQPKVKAAYRARRIANRERINYQKRIQRAGVVPTRPCPQFCEIPYCVRRAVHLDHDHATGKFRGWLCSQCNTALGLAKDNPVLLRGMARYLER